MISDVVTKNDIAPSVRDQCSHTTDSGQKTAFLLRHANGHSSLNSLHQPRQFIRLSCIFNTSHYNTIDFITVSMMMMMHLMFFFLNTHSFECRWLF